jgi:hypothetical protein
MSGAVCGESSTYRSNREGRRVIPPLDSTDTLGVVFRSGSPSAEAQAVRQKKRNTFAEAMYQYRITKYNPVFRDEKGRCTSEEWTSFGDVGEIVSVKEYDS